MKKLILAISMVFCLQATAAFALEYKVVDITDMNRGKSLETTLNKYAKQGWRFEEVIYRQDSATMMIVFVK